MYVKFSAASSAYSSAFSYNPNPNVRYLTSTLYHIITVLSSQMMVTLGGGRWDALASLLRILDPRDLKAYFVHLEYERERSSTR